METKFTIVYDNCLNKQGLKIGCIEEIAYRMSFINSDTLTNTANIYDKNNYGKYLSKLLIDFRVDHLAFLISIYF